MPLPAAAQPDAGTDDALSRFKAIKLVGPGDADASAKGKRRYWLENEAGETLPLAAPPALAGFRLKPAGRLGNQMVQIINAVALARRMNVPRIEIWTGGLISLAAPLTIGPLTFSSPEARLPTDGVFLTGDFFFKDDLAPLLADLTAAEKYETAQAIIKPHFMKPLPEDGEKSADELSIHIRAGDIFRNFGAGYTQPPLAFYKTIIRFGLERALFSKVRLVFEDRGNPCVDALEAWLKDAGIGHRMQSASLEQDLAALVDAPLLSFGFGTFGHAVCLLSTVPSTMFCFAGLGQRFYASFPTVRQLYVVRDVKGGYMKAGDWKNTAAQRRLMLDYPETDLAIRLREL